MTGNLSGGLDLVNPIHDRDDVSDERSHVDL